MRGISISLLSPTRTSLAVTSRYAPLLLSQHRGYAYKAMKEIPILNRPIGDAERPTVTDNTGIDTRTREQKKADFVNYDRHLLRRKELTHEMAKSQYEDVYKFRDTAGKMFVAPNAYFRADKALYMPNFIGRTLLEGEADKKATTAVLANKISVVRVFTSLTGEKHTSTYFYDGEHPDNVVEDGFQMVDINLPDNFATELLVRWHANKIRQQIPDPARHGRYFIARKGVTKAMMEAMNLENKYSGYIYLVDGDCKIRWAACGNASEEERSALWRFVAALQREQQQKK